jgi:hypothetical protein
MPGASSYDRTNQHHLEDKYQAKGSCEALLPEREVDACHEWSAHCHESYANVRPESVHLQNRNERVYALLQRFLAEQWQIPEDEDKDAAHPEGCSQLMQKVTDENSDIVT